MGINGFPINFNPSQAVLFTPTGSLTNLGLRFFLQIFSRTGSANGFPTVATGLAAKGNSQASGLLLASDWNEIDTAELGSGVVLPVMQQGGDIIVWNFGINTIAVYPSIVAATPAQIDALGANLPYNLATGKMQWFRQTAFNQIRSMQLG